MSTDNWFPSKEQQELGYELYEKSGYYHIPAKPEGQTDIGDENYYVYSLSKFHEGYYGTLNIHENFETAIFERTEIQEMTFNNIGEFTAPVTVAQRYVTPHKKGTLRKVLRVLGYEETDEETFLAAKKQFEPYNKFPVVDGPVGIIDARRH